MNTDDRCPRCGARMKSWHELEEDEREVVKRLPAAAEADAERRRLNRWCNQCWHESRSEEKTA